MNQYEAIIFDLDGVIIDTESLHAKAKKAAFEHFGIDVPDTIYAEFIGRTDEDIICHVVQSLANSSLNSREVLEYKHNIFWSLRDEIQLIEGVLQFIDIASKHYTKMGVTTSATRQNQEFAFNKFNLHKWFDVVVTFEDVSKPKPDPSPYVKTTELLNINPSNCIVVEDSYQGIRSAKGAGCSVLAIASSFDIDVLQKEEPKYLVRNFSDATRLFEQNH